MKQKYNRDPSMQNIFESEANEAFVSCSFIQLKFQRILQAISKICGLMRRYAICRLYRTAIQNIHL